MVKSSMCKLVLQFQVEVNSSVNRANRGANFEPETNLFNIQHITCRVIFFLPLPVQHEGTGILRWRSHRQQGSSSRT